MQHKILREYIRNVINETQEGIHVSNVLSNDLTDREQLRSLADDGSDEIASHLMEPEVDMEDCYGPVPPLADDPGVLLDPYVKYYRITPTLPARSKA
jgi:hypothetical protein